ncbi:MAG: permease-like cell division protein FtsX [Lachnospiraceae bacterium]|nr:permease-like cell division protein FtsX [Lachnospiraceae bacterium]
MRIHSFFDALGQGLKNIRRNKMFSFASICTIAACIFLLGMFYAIVVNVQHIVQNVEEQVGITTFFDEGITDEEIENLKAAIEANDIVESVTYISAEEAWENYKAEYFASAPELAEGYADDNPLADSASFEIYLNDISYQEEFVEYLEGLDGIRQVNASATSAEFLTEFGQIVGYVSAAIIAILLGVGIFLISNTVMIGISVRRDEIHIMKLVGATDSYVRAPFLIEGVVIGMLGALPALLIVYVLYGRVTNYILAQFEGVTTLLTMLPVSQIFKVLIPMALLIGAGIGYVGSRITLHKHLQV